MSAISRSLAVLVVATALLLPSTANAGLFRDVVRVVSTATPPQATCTEEGAEGSGGTASKTTCRTALGPIVWECVSHNDHYYLAERACRFTAGSATPVLACSERSGSYSGTTAFCEAVLGAVGLRCEDSDGDAFGTRPPRKQCVFSGVGDPVVIPLPEPL